MRCLGRKCLLFLALLLFFALMKQIFNTIADFLFETDWNAHYTLSFAQVCSRFGADPLLMDNLMYETFGMSGDELIEQYRQGPMSCLSCRVRPRHLKN